jgi:site-specific DNA recombinase
LASFYRHQHDLIADAITAAQALQATDQDTRRRELAATEHQLAMTGAAIDRYLTAFENGTLNPDDLAGRLAQLKARTRQLATSRDELTAQLASAPVVPPPATLSQVADHIGEVMGSGSHNQRKALIEALVAQVKITGPGRIVPVFRIPQITDSGPPSRSEVSSVRALTNLVGPVGFEPTLAGT